MAGEDQFDESAFPPIMLSETGGAGDEAGDAKLCYFWPWSECNKGERCSSEHPAKLDPASGKDIDPAERVSNETWVACQRCLEWGYPVSRTLVTTSKRVLF
jgi:hypothetical protein